MDKVTNNTPSSAIDDIEDAVDQIISPRRAIGWISRVVMVVLILGVSTLVGKMAIHVYYKAEQVTYDHDSFVEKHEAILAAELRIEAAKEAIRNHEKSLDARSGFLSFSRESDRKETARLAQQLFDARNTHASLVAAYNALAGKVTDSSIFGELPSHIEVVVPPVEKASSRK